MTDLLKDHASRIEVTESLRKALYALGGDLMDSGYRKVKVPDITVLDDGSAAAALTQFAFFDSFGSLQRQAGEPSASFTKPLREFRTLAQEYVLGHSP